MKNELNNIKCKGFLARNANDRMLTNLNKEIVRTMDAEQSSNEHVKRSINIMRAL